MDITSLLGIYNVREFGLIPRATADNAPAVQGAIDAAHKAGGGQVWLPADIRIVGVGSTILLPDDIELVIPAGVTLRLLPGANCDVIANADATNGNSRIRMSGAGTIDGNRANQTEASNGIKLVSVADASIEGITIKGCYSAGIVLDTCTRPVVDVIATDNGTHGVSLSDTAYGIIRARSFDNAQGVDAGDGDGINLSGSSTDNVIVSPVCYDSAGESGQQGYGVREAAASSCDRNLIVGGSLTGNLTGTVSLVGSSSKLVDNAATIAQAGTPSTQAFGDSAMLGTSPNAAPLDHKHAMPANPLADGSVTNAKLADGSVTAAKVADGAITGAKLASDVVRATAPAEGRLTLLSGSPVPTTDQTAKTTVYYTPFIGNKIALYDGSAWALRTFPEISKSLNGWGALANLDVFAVWDGSNVVLEFVGWTNDSTRATALAYQDGVLVKSGDTLRRYLGTIRTTSTPGQCEDSVLRRFVWNYYNRVERKIRCVDTTASWTYALSTWRAFNNNSNLKCEFVLGLAEEPVYAVANGMGSSASGSFYAGIGLDHVGANDADVTPWSASANPVTLSAIFNSVPAAGTHYLAPIENTNGNTCTFYGQVSSGVGQSGLIGTVRG